MKNTISLSQFIEMIQGSIAKTPRVPNHDKLVCLLPQLEQMLRSRGDIEIPTAGLLNAIRS